jgi:hypothetical protein
VIDSNSSYLYSVRYPDSVNKAKMLFFNFMPNLTVSFSRSYFGVVLVPDFASRNDYSYWVKLLAAGDRVQVSSCNTGVISSAYRLTSSGLSSSSVWVNLWRWFLVSSRFYGPFFALLALPVYVTLQCVKKVSPVCFSLLSSIL